MDRHQITYETWNAVASLYQDRFMALTIYNDTYDKFCELVLPINAAVLDVGCGPGNIANYLHSIRSDFHIMGIDFSPNMIELARRNNPTLQFEVMDCRDLAAIKCSFNGVIAGFCLPYLSKS